MVARCARGRSDGSLGHGIAEMVVGRAWWHLGFGDDSWETIGGVAVVGAGGGNLYRAGV